MPRTFTNLLNDYQRLTNNSEVANQTFGAVQINDSINTIYNLQGGKLRFLETTKTMSTVANQEAYQTPNGFRKIIDMYVRVGSGTSATIYMPEMIFDPTKWKLVLAYRLGTNDFPYFTYVENQVYRLQPIPSSSGNDIVIRGRIKTAPLTIADYTTGTIVSIANGATTVVGSGTTWTADMVGRYIQIIQTTAANGGDGMWYQIGAYTSATSIELLKPYEGTSISAGSATYTIGQCSAVPEAYDIAILWRSVAVYYDQQGDSMRAKTYWMKYDGGFEAGYIDKYGGLIEQMLDNEGETEEGGYISPFGRTSPNIMTAPYYFPYQQASGL